MTLKEMIYLKIIEGERVASYKIYGEFWYVVRWNKSTYIHYTRKTSYNMLKYNWYLSSNLYPMKWRVQTQDLTMK